MNPPKRKILFLLHLPPPIHGAALMGDYIRNSLLIRNAFDCRFINLQTSRTLAEIGKGKWRKIWTVVLLYARVLSALLKTRYALCYMSINSAPPALYKEMGLVFLIKLFGYAPVYHYHNKGVAVYKGRRLLDKWYKYQFKNARVILLSSLLYPDVSGYIPRDRVYICPNGIPEKPGGREIKKPRVSKSPSIPEALFLSHLMKAKGLWTFLEACNILCEREVSFRGKIVGEPSDIKEEELRQYLAASALSGRVVYEGPKYGAEKTACLEEAGVFVFPTLEDCFPLVILEAFQSGIPVIASSEGAIPEMVEDGANGFLVSRNDPRLLADKMQLLIQNPALRMEFGRAGQRKYERYYTLKQFEQNVATILQRILDETGYVKPQSRTFWGTRPSRSTKLVRPECPKNGNVQKCDVNLKQPCG